MKVLKWLAVVTGGLFVLFLFIVTFIVIVGVGAGVYWFSSLECVELSEADFEIGGSYSSEERATLMRACEKTAGTSESARNSCKCLGDKAESEISRFDRMMLVASFESDFNKMIALTIGALTSDVPPEKISDGNSDEAVLISCGLADPEP